MAIYKGNIKLDANGTLTSSVPAGSILQYDGNTIPAGYQEVTSVAEDISSSINYTASSGVTISSFKATKVDNLLFLNIVATYSSTSNRVIPLCTISNLTISVPTDGYGRTYDSPAGTTVLPASSSLSTTGVVQIYSGGTSRGALTTIILPMPTITST